MIYFFTPYSWEKNIGQAYNQYIRLVPNDDDYICLMDGDIMFLTADFGDHLQNIVNKYPEASLFTCLTNRVGNRGQCYRGDMSENFDVKFHEAIAKDLQARNYFLVSPVNRVISGHLLLFKKKVWREVGGFFEKGILKVDNDFSRKVLLKRGIIYLMEGVYVFHKYRTNGKNNKNHLL